MFNVMYGNDMYIKTAARYGEGADNVLYFYRRIIF